MGQNLWEIMFLASNALALFLALSSLIYLIRDKERLATFCGFSGTIIAALSPVFLCNFK